MSRTADRSQRWSYGLYTQGCTVLHFNFPSHAVSKSNDDMTDRTESRDAINLQRCNNIIFSKGSICVRILWYTRRRTLPMLFFDFISFIIRLGGGGGLYSNECARLVDTRSFALRPSTGQSRFANFAVQIRSMVITIYILKYIV